MVMIPGWRARAMAAAQEAYDRGDSAVGDWLSDKAVAHLDTARWYAHDAIAQYNRLTQRLVDGKASGEAARAWRDSWADKAKAARVLLKLLPR